MLMSKIKIQQFLFGKNHSWSIVGQNLGYYLNKHHLHDVYFYSTDGYDKKYNYFNVKNCLLSKSLTSKDRFDVQISYTAPHNFPEFLQYGNKNRFGIWCYEFPIIPQSMIKYFDFPDYILPPSSFAKENFVNCKIKEEKCKVIPHGIDLNLFENKNKFKIKSKKRYKFLMPLGQPHLRKGINETIEAFYQAFTNKDDVILVAKVPKSSQAAHDVNIYEVISSLNKKYTSHPELELITDFVPSMIELYNACDVIYLLTKAEAFFMPGLEGIGANKIVMTTNYGGQLDFLNDSNSVLVSGEIERANYKALYWNGDIKNYWFKPNLKDAAEKLRYIYENYDAVLTNFQKNYNEIYQKYSWKNVVNLINELIV
jgi:glycosyltransferase involved in cell wall biosynthesis